MGRKFVSNKTFPGEFDERGEYGIPKFRYRLEWSRIYDTEAKRINPTIGRPVGRSRTAIRIADLLWLQRDYERKFTGLRRKAGTWLRYTLDCLERPLYLEYIKDIEPLALRYKTEYDERMLFEDEFDEGMFEMLFED
jgi:hypothetical protein